jgi:small basic protein (TIGR04137 family)
LPGRRERHGKFFIAVIGQINNIAFVLIKLYLLNYMSQHPSLRAASTLGGKRNVLKRFERTELLKKRGQRKDGDRITGLRKTKPDA